MIACLRSQMNAFKGKVLNCSEYLLQNMISPVSKEAFLIASYLRVNISLNMTTILLWPHCFFRPKNETYTTSFQRCPGKFKNNNMNEYKRQQMQTEIINVRFAVTICNEIILRLPSDQIAFEGISNSNVQGNFKQVCSWSKAQVSVQITGLNVLVNLDLLQT